MVKTCYGCGQPLKAGDKAYGIIMGDMSDDDGGFMADDIEWGTVICTWCMDDTRLYLNPPEKDRVV